MINNNALFKLRYDRLGRLDVYFYASFAKQSVY